MGTILDPGGKRQALADLNHATQAWLKAGHGVSVLMGQQAAAALAMMDAADRAVQCGASAAEVAAARRGGASGEKPGGPVCGS